MLVSDIYGNTTTFDKREQKGNISIEIAKKILLSNGFTVQDIGYEYVKTNPRFYPDLFCSGKIHNYYIWFYCEVKHSKYIEKRSYLQCMKLASKNENVLLFTKVPEIMYAPINNVVLKPTFDTERFRRCSDTWLVPRNGSKGNGSGTPFKEINLRSMERWVSQSIFLKHIIEWFQCEK